MTQEGLELPHNKEIDSICTTVLDAACRHSNNRSCLMNLE